MNDQTKADIEAALEATKEVVCIQLAAGSKSPHEDYVYTSNPCTQKWLIQNKGWTVATRSEK